MRYVPTPRSPMTTAELYKNTGYVQPGPGGPGPGTWTWDLDLDPGPGLDLDLDLDLGLGPGPESGPFSTVLLTR